MRPALPTRRPALGTVTLAVVAYVPLLLTHVGKVGADTKQYLYLDPAKLLSRAASMWDPSVGLGTVTHQNIGYLFPMGPYFWAAETIGLPDWVAQRIWLGSIIFLAGLGVRRLLTTLAWRGAGVTVASFAYALSPYLLHYVYKHSVILLPFTALPWLLHFTIRSLRHPGWRDPARFALVALAAGGVNATSLLLVLIAPGLWWLHAVAVERDVKLRDAIVAATRIGLLSAATSIWWVVGLSTQGNYGIDILRATETYTTVSNASSAPEISRGLGYWFFYGIDVIGPWFKAAVTQTQSIPALALSFAVPTVAVAAALWTRFRYRIFFTVVTLTGVVVSVGAHPRDAPSPWGRLFDAFASTRSGLAMRSTPRALPLVALGIAVFLGAGVAALAAWRPARRQVFALAAIVMVVANLSQLWTGRLLDEYLERPEDLPSYWPQVGRRLDEGDRNTRALEAPGIEFANYRWGATVDPITPGLTDRDYVARELVPYGSPASADLLNALDLPLQDGTYQPMAYASLLRMIGAGELVLRNDLEFERFRTPRPRPTAAAFERVEGFGPTESFGPGRPNVAASSAPLLDDLELALPDDLPDPAEVTVHPVERPLGVVRTAPEDRSTLVVAGDGAGLVSTAEAGLLVPEQLTVYAATLAERGAATRALAASAGRVVVTDTNRKAGLRWGSTKDVLGATEMADETPPHDPSDFRLPIFGATGTDHQSVAVQEGGLRVTASAYGNPLTFTPGDRAVNAADGDPLTAWRVGAFSDVRGEWIDLRSTGSAFSGDRIALSQPADVNRLITRIRVIPDGDRSRAVEINLGPGSRSPGTQRVSTGGARRSVRIEVLDTDAGVRASYQGLSGVGFAEIGIDGRAVTEFIRPPVDTVTGSESLGARRPLAYVLRRQTAARESGAPDPELVMRRILRFPTRSTVEVHGQVRLAAAADDATLAEALGDSSPGSVTSSSHLVGDTRWRAAQAVDGDPTTAWQSAIDGAVGSWLEVGADRPVTATVTGLTVMNDGRHSLPSRVHLEVDGHALDPIGLDPRPVGNRRGQRTTLRVDPVTVTGSTIRLVVDDVRPVRTTEWLTDRPQVLPVGIAEIDGLSRESPSDSRALPSDCRDDLISLDDGPVPVRLDGTVGDARAGRPVRVVGCAPSEIPSGDHRLVTRLDGGWNVDHLTLRTRWPADEERQVSAPRTVERTSRTSYRVSLDHDLARPEWLVLGQSFNAGWELTADGESLGPPTLVNGFANGWRLDPAQLADRPTLELTWTPQRTVWIALLLSLLAALACVVLARRAPVPAPREPRGVNPGHIGLLDAFGHPPAVRVSIAVTLGTGIGVGLIVDGWWWAVAAMAMCAAALTTTAGWRALRLITLGLFGGAGAYVALKQWRNGYGLDFNWPQLFDAAHAPMMLAWALLAVECAVEAVRGGWRRDAALDRDEAVSGSASRRSPAARGWWRRSSRS